MLKYDIVIIGAGLYGLYSAWRCGQEGRSVLIIERDPGPFMRATYINQARVHMGYHYPRSFSTAIKSAHYFERFCEDFGFCIHKQFDQVYATSAQFSWTNAEEFQQFCRNGDLRCDSIAPEWYFNSGMCDGAFLTKEYTYDAQILKKWFVEQISAYPNVRVEYNHRPDIIEQTGDTWKIIAQNLTIETSFILNAAYAGVNDVLRRVYREDEKSFRLKYEKCEIILCTVNDALKNTGLTVMDGPFFSLMPFGKTGLHSLTSVTFTPHETSYDTVATFPCQNLSGGKCSPGNLYNCNECRAKPESSWSYMSQLARKYIRKKYQFEYHSSLFSMKPILMASEMDDSRPTVIKVFSETPRLVSVLSGKINTVYDLDEVLLNG